MIINIEIKHGKKIPFYMDDIKLLNPDIIWYQNDFCQVFQLSSEKLSLLNPGLT